MAPGTDAQKFIFRACELFVMMLTCPSCGTRYLVPDTAIGPAGRKVRCAACKHSWFENPPVEHRTRDLVDSSGQVIAALHEEPSETAVQPTLPPSWVTEGMPVRTAPEHEFANTGTAPGPAALPVIDPFAYQPPFRPRRNKARMWTIAAVAIAVVLVALNIALWTLGGIDGISARLTGAPVVSTTESLLQLAPTSAPERRRLASGHEILSVTGRVDNPTSTTLPIPDIQAELLSREGKPIYSWVIPAPAPSLDGGASIPFDGVTVDVPAEANRVRLSFVTGAAR